MQESQRRITRLVVRPIIESLVVGMLGGAIAQTILPGEKTSFISGAIPGFAIGLIVGMILAYLSLRTDTRRAQLAGGGLKVFLWVIGAVAAAFSATAFYTSNPQIPGLERLILCCGVAVAYGFLTYRAVTPKGQQFAP